MLSAWDNETEEIVVIRRGQADELRPLCHPGRLVCPILECSEPAFTSRRLYVNRWGTEVVDGFRHLVAPDDTVHTPESVRHQEGKSQVADWLRRLGLSKVSLERSVKVEHRPPTGDRPGRDRIRRPDVQAVTREGQKMAFEIQVSPIAEDLWRQRTSELAGAGFTVLWLWTWPVSDPAHAGTTAMRAQIAGGARPWFLDPQDDGGPLLAATHQIARVDDARFQVPPFDPSAPMFLTWRPLDDHHLGGGRLQVGAGEIDDSAAHHEAAKRQATRSAGHDRSAGGGRTMPPPLDAAALARAEARRAERELRASTRGTAPARGPLPPHIHALCERVSGSDQQIWTTPVEWKSALAWRLLARDQGAKVAISDIVTWVEQKYPCEAMAATAPVRAFLRGLQAVGAVECSATQVVVLTPAVIQGPSK